MTAEWNVPRLVKTSPDGIPPDLVPLRLVMQPSGRSILLSHAELVVGRHSGCDLRLPLPDVSRRHCRFYWHEGAWWLEDLESTNGVVVNGHRTARHPIQIADVVKIGGYTFTVQPPEGFAAGAERLAS